MSRSRSTVLTVLALLAGCSASQTVTDAPDATACSAAAMPECYHAPDGLCGDSSAPAVCVSGLWACPAGTIRGSACRCFVGFNGNDASGACTCGASGWECPDAGAVVARPFACGDTLRCDLNAEYCEESSGGVMAGVRFACRLFPAACSVEPSCPCLVPDPGASRCRSEPDRSFHVSRNAP